MIPSLGAPIHPPTPSIVPVPDRRRANVCTMEFTAVCDRVLMSVRNARARAVVILLPSGDVMAGSPLQSAAIRRVAQAMPGWIVGEYTRATVGWVSRDLRVAMRLRGIGR